jgi:hypothetical protein
MVRHENEEGKKMEDETERCSKLPFIGFKLGAKLPGFQI